LTPADNLTPVDNLTPSDNLSPSSVSKWPTDFFNKLLNVPN